LRVWAWCWFSIRQSGRTGRSFSILSLLGNAEIHASAAFFRFIRQFGVLTFDA
jgi:hypothetical protein